MAGWRYAVLVKIVPAEAIWDQEDATLVKQEKEDKENYKSLIKASGEAIWDQEDAVEFVADLTGYSKDICKKWLDYDWSVFSY